MIHDRVERYLTRFRGVQVFITGVIDQFTGPSMMPT